MALSLSEARSFPSSAIASSVPTPLFIFSFHCVTQLSTFYSPLSGPSSLHSNQNNLSLAIINLIYLYSFNSLFNSICSLIFKILPKRQQKSELTSSVASQSSKTIDFRPINLYVPFNKADTLMIALIP